MSQTRLTAKMLIGGLVFGIAVMFILFEDSWLERESNKHAVINTGNIPVLPLVIPPSQTECVPYSRDPEHRWSSSRHEDEILYENFFGPTAAAKHMQSSKQLVGKWTKDGLRNGVFIEIGALDGAEASNTRFYEQHLNWTGLLIEASPNTFPSLSQRRQCSWRIWSAICDEPSVAFSVPEGHDTLSGIPGKMSQVFWDQYHIGHQKSLSAVPCGTMTGFLEMAGYDRVDLMSVDVEGVEEMVLRHTDFKKIDVRMVLVELDLKHRTKDQVGGVEALLEREGFVRSEIQCGPRNQLWLNPNYQI